MSIIRFVTGYFFFAKAIFRSCSLLKKMPFLSNIGIINKKVFLRERKRHTARRVAIANQLFRGGGGGGGVSLYKNFFCQSEHVSSQIWCQKFFPLLGGGGGGGGGPLTKIFLSVWTCIKPDLVSKIFPFTETGYPPPPPGPGTPPPKVNRQIFPSINITFPRTTYAGGNYWFEKKFPSMSTNFVPSW